MPSKRGLIRKSTAPALIERTTVAMSARADIRMTDPGGSSRSPSSNSNISVSVASVSTMRQDGSAMRGNRT